MARLWLIGFKNIKASKGRVVLLLAVATLVAGLALLVSSARYDQHTCGKGSLQLVQSASGTQKAYRHTEKLSVGNYSHTNCRASGHSLSPFADRNYKKFDFHLCPTHQARKYSWQQWTPTSVRLASICCLRI